MTYLREHADERVLVHAARGAHAPVRLPLRALGVTSADEVVPLHGEPVAADGAEAVLPSGGPAAHAWVLRSTRSTR
jgi:alpha-glucosidase